MGNSPTFNTPGRVIRMPQTRRQDSDELDSRLSLKTNNLRSDVEWNSKAVRGWVRLAVVIGGLCGLGGGIAAALARLGEIL